MAGWKTLLSLTTKQDSPDRGSSIAWPLSPVGQISMRNSTIELRVTFVTWTWNWGACSDVLNIRRKVTSRGGGTGGTGSETSVGAGRGVGVDSGVSVGRGLGVVVGSGIGVGKGVGGGSAVRVADTAVPTFRSNSMAESAGDLVGETVAMQAGDKISSAAVALARATNLRKKTILKKTSLTDPSLAGPSRQPVFYPGVIQCIMQRSRVVFSCLGGQNLEVNSRQ